MEKADGEYLKGMGSLKTQAVEAKKLFDELNVWLETKGVEYRVEASAPVSTEEIAKAENTLGVKLPPSYVEFVTAYGTFDIDGELTGRGLGNDSHLFTPDEIVEKTGELRQEFASYGSESDEVKILQDAIPFCADPNDEFFYLFVVSSADTSNEMNVRGFDYQNLGMNDPWIEGNMTFVTAMAEIIDIIKQNY